MTLRGNSGAKIDHFKQQLCFFYTNLLEEMTHGQFKNNFHPHIPFPLYSIKGIENSSALKEPTAKKLVSFLAATHPTCIQSSIESQQQDNNHIFSVTILPCSATSVQSRRSFCHLSLVHTAKNQNQKFEKNIRRKGIAWPQSQFPHSWVYERYLYSHDWSTYSAAGNMLTDPENM